MLAIRCLQPIQSSVDEADAWEAGLASSPGRLASREEGMIGVGLGPAARKLEGQ